MKNGTTATDGLHAAYAPLTGADGFRVTSRGVVMRHKGTDHDPRDIGQELDVQVVVEGTVRVCRARSVSTRVS